MKKNVVIIVIAAILIIALAGVAFYLYTNLEEAKADKQEMQELMELDRQEMENEQILI